MFAKVYEDNAGLLHAAYIGDDGRAWTTSYHMSHAGYFPEELAGLDWCAVVLKDMDPLAEGWDGLTGCEAGATIEELEDTAEVIADYDDCSGSNPLGIDHRRLGVAGRIFAGFAES